MTCSWNAKRIQCIPTQPAREQNNLYWCSQRRSFLHAETLWLLHAKALWDLREKKKNLLIFNYERFNSLRNRGVVALRNWNRLRLSPEKRDDKAGVSASLRRRLQPSHFFGSKFLIYNQSVSEGCRHASSYVYFWTHVLCQTFIISIGISGCQRRVYA